MKTRISSIVNWYTLAALLAALVGSAVQVTPVSAASIVVNSPADQLGVVNDTFCTLREALLAAQQNASAGGCTGGSGADVITFDDDYTITLVSQLGVASDVTIQGNGAASTIVQAEVVEKTASHRVFEVGTQGSLTLKSLTVRHGSCNGTCASPSGVSPNGGAGIWNEGTLAVINSTISNNFAVDGAGIWNAGDLKVEDSVFSSNNTTLDGAGIWNRGTLTVTGSTFSGNSARNGGGMVTHSGSAEIINSTFSGNSADSTGGGIFNDESFSVIVGNSTFSGNSAPSGGGGIFNSARMTLVNTIVANSPSGGNCAGPGVITNEGGNLDSGSTCGWGSAGGSLSNTNPMLDMLSDNGGSTKTHAVLQGSPAIGRGISVSCPPTDQRGVARPLGTFCDTGAYESYSIVVDTSTDTIADDGFCSLREAIIAANNNVRIGGCAEGSEVGIDSIRISVRDSITLTEGEQLPPVTSLIIIIGAGPDKAIVQANTSPNVADYRVFEVAPPGNLTLNQLTVRHGKCNGSCLTINSAGGGILNQGSLTVINSTISDNSAIDGGGIFNQSSLTVTNSTFSMNSATNSGGGIWSNSLSATNSILTVTNSTFSANSATNGGGGVENNGTAILRNSTFSGNSASNGGGISNSATVTLKNTIVASSPDGGNCAGTINDGGGNLGWPDITCPGLNADPRLGPLVDNDGPTPTMALLAGSPAIDAGVSANCQDTDQRGGTRPLGSPCDIGAYEFGATIIVPPTFADVPGSYWAWDFIERLFAAGITGGCASSPLSYCPEDTVTRAQMAVFLLRGIHGASYAPPGLVAGTGFGDVPSTYWAATFIKQLAAEGITSGCGGGNYCPEQPVTRAQIAIFLLRSKHGASYTPPGVGPGTGFGDVPPSYWAAAWIKQLVTEGITAGCGGGNYCPESPVTRAQMAVFLVKTFSLP